MFIKTSTRKKKNGKIYTTHYLVEGYRDKVTGKVKHQSLANLSNLPAEIILTLKTLLKNQQNKLTEYDLESLEVLCSKEYGSIKLFQSLYKKYFGKYFNNSKYSEAIEAIVINKIFNPKSKNSLKDWISTVDLGYDIKNKNLLYEALDYLEDKHISIEKGLSKKHNSIEGNNILLYDITSTYFEGKGAENICKYGYSRDHRKDRVQVNIGVITNKDGTPISIEIIAGNISDKETMEDQIRKIQERFNIQELTFVFDRGMKSTLNLANIKQAGYDYITALSHSELKEKCQSNKYLQMSLFDKRNLSDVEIDGNFYSLVHNPIKAEQDKKTRQRLIDKTIEKLDKITHLKRKYTILEIQDKVSKVINKYKCQKYIQYEILELESVNTKDAKCSSKIYGKLEYKIDRDILQINEQYDGFYMIESSDKFCRGSDAVDQYKDLQLVERAFDSVKNHLNIRPVYHYKEKRIKGHILSSFISYFLLHKFKLACKDLLQNYSLNTLLTELTKIHKVHFKITHFCFSKITSLSELQLQILKQFNFSLLS